MYMNKNIQLKFCEVQENNTTENNSSLGIPLEYSNLAWWRVSNKLMLYWFTLAVYSFNSSPKGCVVLWL